MTRYQVKLQNKDATLYVGDLEKYVTEELLLELFMQAGPVVGVYIPRDRLTNQSNGYGFVEYRTTADATYAATILNGIKLFGRPIRISAAPTAVENEIDVGAKLYVGNLAPEVNDVTLSQLFKQFGNLQTCRVVIDPTTGKSHGHGFVSYDNFDSADNAMKMMNGQYVQGQPIIVNFAYKADSKKGEQHGDKSERLIAPSTAQSNLLKKLQKQTYIPGK